MMQDIIKKIKNKLDLTKEEMTNCMCHMMAGDASDVEIASFLTAMTMKGESVEEITAGAHVLRDKALSIKLNEISAIDTCGTGGDGGGTYNVSTAVAFVVAAAGVPVVKHGNRSVSSKCGSADVLEALGANILVTPEQAEEMVREIGLCFIYAPAYHGAMKHVAKVRKALGFRTLFNILGPLANPARVGGQVIGVYDEKLTTKMAYALKGLGTKRGLVVHGKDGMDELSVSDDSMVTELSGDLVKSYVVKPEQYGLGRYTMEDLQGGDAVTNSGIIRDLFAGEKGPKRDLLVLNAGAALYIGGDVKTIEEGVRKAEALIDNMKALNLLDRFIAYSNGFNN